LEKERNARKESREYVKTTRGAARAPAAFILLQGGISLRHTRVFSKTKTKRQGTASRQKEKTS
jgi:hypothetical protein